jgi:UDP-N-acetylmuramate--alanine ligase
MTNDPESNQPTQPTLPLGEPGAASFDLLSPRRLHIVGLGGVGMSGLAAVLVGRGHRVSGSDLKESPYLTKLRLLGVRAEIGHRPEHVPDDVDVVVISTAIPESNPEVRAARERGIPVLRRADLLRLVIDTRRTIAVAGTHGKTTTTTMTALILREAGWRPSFLIGGHVNETGSNAHDDDGDWLVVEADESDGTFISFDAEAVIVTNIESDHMDHWKTFDRLVEGFREFLSRPGGPRIACADDPVAARLAAEIPGVVTYGFSALADYRIERSLGAAGGSDFVLTRFTRVSGDSPTIEPRHDGVVLGTISLPVPGRHNTLNAAGAAALALELGVAFPTIATALGRYAGVARRFHFRGEVEGVTLVDDYAHLPTEIVATIATAREGQWSRVIAVFQPHHYFRTSVMWQDFARALVGADIIVVADVYGPGETPLPGVSGKRIVESIAETDPSAAVLYNQHRSELLDQVRAVARSGDIVLTMGSGDVTNLAEEWLRRANGESTG